MKRRLTPRRLINYVILIAVAYIAYKVLTKGNSTPDSFEDEYDKHPKNAHVTELKVSQAAVKVKDKSQYDFSKVEGRITEIHKEEHAKENKKNDFKVEEKVPDLNAKKKNETEEAFERLNRMRPERDFGWDGDDLQTAKKKLESRQRFFQQIAKSEEEDHDIAGGDHEEDDDFMEHDDNFTFLTAASSDTYHGALQFVASVQQYFPKSKIAIFDLGLNEEEISKLKSLCQVQVESMYLTVWPQHIQDIDRGFWRPLLLHLALGKYGHYVYVEPERKFNHKDIAKYFEHSRFGGVSLVGIEKDFSPFVVTHPDMYHYIGIDTRRLQHIPFVEVTMIIAHNIPQVRQKFTNYLLHCALEEWCMAPPGAKRQCNHRFHPNSRLWADCHRFDESAINILLASWHKYDTRHYVKKDKITGYYDGRDVSKQLKVCVHAGHGDL